MELNWYYWVSGICLLHNIPDSTCFGKWMFLYSGFSPVHLNNPVSATLCFDWNTAQFKPSNAKSYSTFICFQIYLLCYFIQITEYRTQKKKCSLPEQFFCCYFLTLTHLVLCICWAADKPVSSAQCWFCWQLHDLP